MCCAVKFSLKYEHKTEKKSYNCTNRFNSAAFEIRPNFNSFFGDNEIIVGQKITFWAYLFLYLSINLWIFDKLRIFLNTCLQLYSMQNSFI